MSLSRRILDKRKARVLNPGLKLLTLHCAPRIEVTALYCIAQIDILPRFRYAYEFPCYLARRQKTFQHNQCRTDTDGSIGKVEGGEVPVADVEVDHIDNEAVPQAVEQVAQRAANNQRVSDIV